MGHHYVPQKYLSAFAEPAAREMIWMFDKSGGPSRRAAIAKVAQEPGYYKPEEEADLASVVENPANTAIRQLLGGEAINEKERAELSLYIAVMLKRVPYRRRKVYETIVPPVLREVFDETRADLQRAAETGDLSADLAARRLTELDALEERYKQDLPDELHDAVRRPWPTHKMVATVYNMAWRILTTSGPIYFMTTDNPAFYFECFGIGTEQSELTFPLATTHCLHGCWQGSEAGPVYLQATQAFVKEANRRVASAVERFAFYHQDAAWIQPLLQKAQPYLSQIRW